MTEALSPRRLLARYGLNPKKRYGQNFLIDGSILAKIVDASGVGRSDLAIEIGAGLGVLTEALAARAARVVAIEIDRTLTPILRERLAGFGNVEIIEADALDVDVSALVADRGYAKARVAANLPYYVTTPLLFHLFAHRAALASITVMTQKEVAERVCAEPGGKAYGALTLAAQYAARAAVAARVPPSCFYPAPEVDSCVLTLEPYDTPPVQVDEAALFRLVKAAFATRRKTLANCLADGLNLPKADTAAALAAVGLPADARGERLSLAQFAVLCAALKC